MTFCEKLLMDLVATEPMLRLIVLFEAVGRYLYSRLGSHSPICGQR